MLTEWLFVLRVWRSQAAPNAWRFRLTDVRSRRTLLARSADDLTRTVLTALTEVPPGGASDEGTGHEIDDG